MANIAAIVPRAARPCDHRRMRRVVAALALAGCAGTFDVPTERMPITRERSRASHHSHWEKGGVELGGLTCGADFERAVSGVPEAEARMADCRRSTTIFAIGASGFVVLPLAGIGVGELADHDATGRWFVAGAALGGAAFVVAFIAAYEALAQQDDAIHIYNRGLAPP
jgi:hypothetical protein